MKVLLVNPSSPRKVPAAVRAELRYDPPLAALYLGSFLAERGIPCDIVDTAVGEIDMDAIQRGEYRLIRLHCFHRGLSQDGKGILGEDTGDMSRGPHRLRGGDGIHLS